MENIPPTPNPDFSEVGLLTWIFPASDQGQHHWRSPNCHLDILKMQFEFQAGEGVDKRDYMIMTWRWEPVKPSAFSPLGWLFLELSMARLTEGCVYPNGKQGRARPQIPAQLLKL